MKDVEKATKWYEENRTRYASLATKVENIIRENLEQDNIQYHSITSRGKDVESFSRKAESEKYSEPVKEIKDMAGVRVITYLESDVQKVADIIEKLFDIDKENSVDQSQLLGSDRLGYRSVHYVAKFDRARSRVPEYAVYKNLPFEIQIRSILQHAWAEIEHDRNYKFTGKLPTELERRFYLISGMLECADREFVSIADEIDKYKESVVEELGKGELDIEINTASLKEYLSNKFKKLIEQGRLSKEFGGGDELGKQIVEEVKLFGISRLSQLDRIIPEDFQDNMIELNRYNNFAGLMRAILIINDVKKYFQVSWRESWGGYHRSGLNLLEKYYVNIANMTKYIKIIEA